MRPCGLNEHPSKVVKSMQDEEILGEQMDFQQYNNITHVEVPSSMADLLIMCFEYTKLIWKET
jgi:hypothetical protein